jgi:hypothetical protein
VDLKKLTTANWVLGGSGIALFIFSFFPWFTLGDFGSRSAWSNFFSLIAVLLALVIVGVLVVERLLEVDLPELPVAMGLAYLVASGVVFLLVLLQLIIGDSVGGFGVSVDLDRGIGIWLGLLASAGMVAGGFLELQAAEEGAGGGDAGPPQSF